MSRTVAGRAKTPGGVPGENGFCRGPQRREIPEADGGGRAAPDPGKRGRRCRIGAGLESEGKHLVLLVADAQHEVVQGAAKDGVGAVIEQLEWWDMAIPLDKHS